MIHILLLIYIYIHIADKSTPFIFLPAAEQARQTRNPNNDCFSPEATNGVAHKTQRVMTSRTTTKKRGFTKKCAGKSNTHIYMYVQHFTDYFTPPT